MGRENKTPKQVIYVCNGDKCKKRGGKELGKLFRELVKAAGLKDDVEVIKTDCTDRCKMAPIMCIQPQNIWLYETTEFKMRQAFQEYVLHQPPKENPSGLRA